MTKENTVKQTVKPVDRQPGQQTTRLTDRYSLETGIPPTATRNNLTGSTGNPWPFTDLHFPAVCESMK